MNEEEVEQTADTETDSDVSVAQSLVDDAINAEADEPVFPTIKVRDRKFRTVTRLPGYVSLQIGMLGSKRTTGLQTMSAFDSVLQCGIHPDDRDEFFAFLVEADPPIFDEELYNSIVTDVLAAVSGRPTNPS